MAEKTGIEWCDSTFNCWLGCSRVGQGCDHCYAEAQDKRKRWGGTTHWGAGVARYRTSAANWAQPIAWNKKAAKSGKPWRVFCASLADVFDNEVPDAWRSDLFSLIAQTSSLSWLLVTKRIGNVARMVPYAWTVAFPKHVRLLITVCNQEEADRDIPKLLALPCKNGISYEPALGPVDWRPWLVPNSMAHSVADLRSVQWIIIGGESAQGGHLARPFDVAWARGTIKQCNSAGVPVFVKQIGPNPTMGYETSSLGRALRDGGYTLKDRAGADPAEWPEDLRVRKFPS